MFYDKFIFFLGRCLIANIKPSLNPRKRGGQPGNHNALKHGYYARHFRPSEIEDLEQLTPGLQDEINMIRIFIRRVIAGTDPDATLAENLEVMRHLSFATLTLTRLVRTHLLYPVKSPQDELHEQVNIWPDKNVWPPGLIPEGFFDKEQSE